MMKVETNAESLPPPFFVVGCPRSGTTLVAQMLDSHSRMAVYLETNYYTTFASDRHRYGDLSQPSNLNRLIADFREALRIQGVKPPEVADIQAELSEASFEGVLAAWLRVNARQQGKIRGGEKTPAHVGYLEEILTGFPESPVIFVMRDPRDAIASMRKRFDISMAGATWIWNMAYLKYTQASRPVFLIRYEDLVHEPEKYAREMCEFIGEAYEPDMLRFYERIPEHILAIPNLPLGKLNEPVATTSIGNFRQLPEADIAKIEAACAAGMAAMGYSFTTNPEIAASDIPQHLPFRYFLLDKLRYYRWNPERWKRGWFRWRILMRLRLRYLLQRVGK